MPETGPLTCPFTIVIDTREQRPFAFDRIRCDADQRRRPLIVPTVRGTIRQGDYSILGMESFAAVERKSAADLFGTLGQGRNRFVRELVRLQRVAAGGGVVAVVVEADWSEILLAPPDRSRLNPKTVFRSVVAWQQRFPGIHWWFCPNRTMAETVTFRILERYWKDHRPQPVRRVREVEVLATN